ncbi:MAG: hypothetical protein ACRDNK_01025, partial [Solirubrobacteraceae bacterium]
QIAFEAKATRPDAWTTPEGTLRASFPIRLLAGKSRQGVGIPDTRATIESEQDPDGSYTWVRLEAGDAAPDATQQLGDRILAFMGEQQDRRARLAEIAEHLGTPTNNGGLSRALSALQGRKTITKPERGLYALV